MGLVKVCRYKTPVWNIIPAIVVRPEFKAKNGRLEFLTIAFKVFCFHLGFKFKRN